MSASQLTSLSLLDRLHRPDDGAWELFVSIYQPVIYRHLLAAGVDTSDIDDLVQDTLAGLLVSLPGFRHNGRTGAFRKWLRVVVARRAIEFVRRKRTGQAVQVQLGYLHERVDQSLQEFFDREHDEYVVARLLETIRSEFTATTWSAFEEQVMGGRSAQEVADELGRSVNSVLLCKSRVLRRLRELGKGLIEC